MRTAAAIVLLLAAAACRRQGSDGAAAAKPAAPDQIIGNFSVDNFAGGAREWTLEAPKAYVYDPEKRVEVDRPRIQFYEKGRPGAQMEAGRGRFHTDRRDMRMWDGVVMVSTDGARVESPWVDYLSAEDRMVSTAPVTVTRQGSVLRGVGWEAKSDLSRVVVHHQTIEYVEPRK